ncbi:MAG: sigma-54 dependent transcriptional regulator [Syntrophales bacterium]|jgi:DNA-binding NtrC family response regulator|nr:sigma-54 dependent transcriptional regulator [Syntrophales bacterium]NLN60531.1 sigma-54-dependent Fis family transcriptional regulator [Deltaproteobacteria bacterium]
MHRILIVDDELNMRLVLKAMLTKEGYEVLLAEDGLSALEILKSNDIATIVTDLKMPRLDGMGLLNRVAKEYPSIPIIIITAYGTVNTAVDALKKGAFDYITKPFDQDDLRNVIRKAIRTRELNQDEVLLNDEEIDRYGIIGSSPQMMEIYETIRQVAPTTTAVLISGETGTGKELIAHAVHRNSPRRENPFIKINCGAITEHLVESELFGYEKGAFTGAAVTKPGRFELAHTGTLFLDEIGELPRDNQVKLLHVLQNQEFERVGGIRTIKIDVRIIAATNRNLLQEVKEGRFREDLFYRLNVFPIHLPPLRERPDDILPLMEYFLDKCNHKLERNVRQEDPRINEMFQQYAWPGNVREMENIIERLVLVSKDSQIHMEDIPTEIKYALDTTALTADISTDRPLKALVKDHTEEMEKHLIAKVLDECGQNVTRTAQQLGFSRKGLQLKMIKYGLRKE